MIKKEEIFNKLNKYKDNVGELSNFLENIGRLYGSDLGICFIPLLNHENEKIRCLAVKNIGKLSSYKFYDILNNLVYQDSSTMVKREAVSSIGRMRDARTIDGMLKILSNEDPKIVCQAIRGLLHFKGNERIDESLKTLLKHPNEMVKQVIIKEYFSANYIDRKTVPHVYSLPALRNVVVNEDVLRVLSIIPDESFHLTFTSPPYYNARDYSIYPSYEAYLDFLSETFKETMRVTKEGRFLIVNTSPIIVPRISRSHSSKRYPIPFDLHARLVNMGWEFIDDIVWMKPEYSVKNRVGGFQQHRKPLAYKPNTVTEYLMVYRKPTDKLIDWNIHQYSMDIINKSKVHDGFESTNVWQICPKSDKVHSAVFPEELCRKVIEYYSYVGDLVFDPFGGSGTFGRVAKSMDRYFFLTEKDYRYFNYMQSFIKKNMGLDNEFSTKFLNFEEFKNKLKE